MGGKGIVRVWGPTEYSNEIVQGQLKFQPMTDTMSAIEERWQNLISVDRLRQEPPPNEEDKGNEFLSDYYRVVFASSFRRLQDKTQVNPLASTDFVRKRLTHSFEVAAVGERIARVIAEMLDPRIGGNEYRDRFGKIVATACLLHDIGNPAFGHEGEAAIRKWADEVQDEIDDDFIDYRAFDGNAQGFRIAVRLQHHGKPHGLNLTAATLAATLKYPNLPKFDSNGRVKASVFNSEEEQFKEIQSCVGLEPGQRHPLSYVVEAADDIVNRLVDLEDGLKLGYIHYSEVVDLLDKSQNSASQQLLENMEKRRTSCDVGSDVEHQMWAFQDFRVNATREFAIECEEVFVNHIDALEEGTFDGDLVSAGEFADLYDELCELENKIFEKADIVRTEAGGKTAIEGLLRMYLESSRSDRKLFDRIPEYPILEGKKEGEQLEIVRRIVDYVSGMTDRYVISHYQQISGMSL